MEKSVRSVLVFVAVSILISSHPTDAWYKQSTGPSYYSVGRASGLLSGIRRSPYVRRSEGESALDSGETPGVSNSAMPDLSSRQTPVLKNMVNYLIKKKTHVLVYYIDSTLHSKRKQHPNIYAQTFIK